MNLYITIQFHPGSVETITDVYIIISCIVCYECIYLCWLHLLFLTVVAPIGEGKTNIKGAGANRDLYVFCIMEAIHIKGIICSLSNVDHR